MTAYVRVKCCGRKSFKEPSIVHCVNEIFFSLSELPLRYEFQLYHSKFVHYIFILWLCATCTLYYLLCHGLLVSTFIYEVFWCVYCFINHV